MTVAIKLGPRLQAVASFVPEGAKLGDIGTDHAYLPIALHEAQKITKAVAIDVNEGPYQSALTAVKARHLEKVIEVRSGNGLRPLTPGEVDVLAFAGMGGRTILNILADRPEILNSITDLVVQPQGAEGPVRLTLLYQGWRLKAERLAEEDGRLYVIMAYSKKVGWSEAELLEKEEAWNKRLQPLKAKEMPAGEFFSVVHKLVWQFGPLVLEKRGEVLDRYLMEYKTMLSRRLKQMKKAQNIKLEAKIQEVCTELALVEGMHTWEYPSA